MRKAILNIENLNVAYHGNVVLEDANLCVHENDFVGVVGPNGGGKTTLIKAILSLVKPQSGKIHFNISQKEVGYLPQVNQLDKQFPITVLDVVLSGKPEFWFVNRGSAKKARIEKAELLLNEMGALHLAKRAFGSLSGGQMQRVLLCRALINDPKLLILDEPDTYVDSKFESELYANLGKLNEKMAIILVSHDIGTISSYVKTIACINKQLHYHPDNSITAEQLEAYNCPLQIISHGDIPHTVLSKHKH